MANEGGSTLSLKLLVDKQGERVLLAEAGKDFVDFLFHLMTLPVGSVIKLLKNNGGMVGCGGNLYRSIQKLSDEYMESATNKKALLKPKSTSYRASFPLLLPDSSPSVYKTSSGYVKEAVTYMVMDDLEVKPMSTISTITILNQFKVKDIGDLEEKEIAVGMNEALKLLKTSLRSKNVLTDVFFRKV